jgi:hypothetical protein
MFLLLDPFKDSCFKNWTKHTGDTPLPGFWLVNIDKDFISKN